MRPASRSEQKLPTVRDRSSPVVVYMHPAAAKALKLHAVQNDTKVHDLLIEAVEDWFRGHGLKEPVRVT
jgi:hypothetical protein